MIAAFAKASQVLGEQTYLEAALRASDFFLEKMRGADGALYHRYVQGERAIEGFLDDYAFFTWGLIEVYEACFEAKYVQAAQELTQAMTTRFWDETGGGFYFTPKNKADALGKRKEIYDGALPSGNSVALLNLLRLARLSDGSSYEEIGACLSRTFAAEAKDSPTAHTFLLLGVDFALGPSFSVVLVGESKEENMLNLLVHLRKTFFPNMVVSLKTLSGAGFGYEKIDGKVTAYVCRERTCMPPTNSAEKMLEFLGMTK
jgi:uncharacterized protein YyaL (SSP411 family)